MSEIAQTAGDRIITKIGTLQEQLRTYEFPALYVDIVTDDGETFAAVRCPRCDYLVDGEDLYAVDTRQRWNQAGDIYEAIDSRRVEFDSDNWGDFGETLYCIHVNHAVSLPKDWSEDSSARTALSSKSSPPQERRNPSLAVTNITTPAT